MIERNRAALWAIAGCAFDLLVFCFLMAAFLMWWTK